MARNYIEIDGVSSLTISGLYIKDLPPITKPPMRYYKEEIDGRDGDIITRLGYGAYDREMTIGLAGDYDIDEIIKFFNPTPITPVPNIIEPYTKFVFSNEPTKQYWGQILEQIDFNHLIKFKTATVKIHVLPFKYKKNPYGKHGSSSYLPFNNDGNIYAKPIIKVQGTGTVAISLNNTQVFEVDLGDTSTTMFLFTNEMNAATYSNGAYTLANRQVTGDYSTFQAPVGQNTLTFSGGNITETYIELFCRWV